MHWSHLNPPLKGPSQLHLCLCLHKRGCPYVLFGACQSKENHCEATEDTGTYFQEHNLQ